jgi:acetylornithine/succinyldiaminopimelate/putrescine aminotransferase
MKPQPAYDYGLFSFESKEQFFEKSREYWNPGKTDFWLALGIDLVVDRREGYFLYDMTGKRLIDLHLNGGTYSLGHRHPELLSILQFALEKFDVGNHHFPSVARTALSEALVKSCGPNMQYAVFGSGGGEAIDVAIKTARYATKRRKIVSIIKAYHGHTGLAVGTGDQRFSAIFLSERHDEFVQVPFNDLNAMEDALRKGDTAAVILETIPATYGFPMPRDGYLMGVKALCEKYGALYIADEVQTGLMRTGVMWGYQKYGVTPDIMVTAKGISGGLYPISACVIDKRYGGWLKEDGFAHISSMGGAEPGCFVALKVLEICHRPETADSVKFVADFLGKGLARIQAQHPEFFVGIRQNGLVIGLEFDHPQGALHVCKALYDNGVWAIFSTLDPRVLQFKPGLFKTRELCEEVLQRLERGIDDARQRLPAQSGASIR